MIGGGCRKSGRVIRVVLISVQPPARKLLTMDVPYCPDLTSTGNRYPRISMTYQFSSIWQGAFVRQKTISQIAKVSSLYFPIVRSYR